LKRIIALFLVFFLFHASNARTAAAQGISLIRDTETEQFIRFIAEPIFAAAGLSTDFVEVHIVNDSTLNAFVGGGQRIFFNAGLLLKTSKPRQVSAIIAHETGHIAGGHLLRTRDALQAATAQSIVATIFGAAVMAAAGVGAGTAVFGGGAQVAQRSFLQYSRTQESTADQAAIGYLDSAGVSVRGLVEVFEILGERQPLLRSSEDAYLMSHPLPRERIDAVQRRVAQAPNRDFETDAATIEAFNRVRAKLQGYLGKPRVTFRLYPEEDQTIVGLYARAFAHHRLGETKQALAHANVLLSREPENPYFHELAAQVYYENGRVNEARLSYDAAIRYAPNEPLLRIGLAQAQIALNDPAYIREAIAHLEEAVRIDRNSSAAWRSLAIAYGRDGQFGRSSLASAERALLSGRGDQARTHAKRAEEQLPVGSPGAIRAGDIQNMIGG
jgi:predicted Zn-dependent protease